MQDDETQTNTAKPLMLFVTIVLLAGFGVFIMIKNSGNKEPKYESPNKNLASSFNEVQTQSPEPKSDTDLVKEAVELPNSGKEVQGMSDQKMTVEQKLAVKAPDQLVDVSINYTATLKTTMGEIVIALDAKNRPQTVNSFIYLSRLGFYDGTVFHRIISNFMIQGGDPMGTGTGGPAYKFADELTAPNSNAKGTISMANAGPNTNGSQFFINLVDNNYLDAKHSVFGYVIQGLDVVESIGKVATGSGDKPLTPVVIESIEIAQT